MTVFDPANHCVGCKAHISEPCDPDCTESGDNHAVAPRVTADGYLDRMRRAILMYRDATAALGATLDGLPHDVIDVLECAERTIDLAAVLDDILASGDARLPAAWRCAPPAGMRAYVLEHTHRHGNTITVHATETGLLAEEAKCDGETSSYTTTIRD